MQVPAQVEYEKAASVAHALALLARYGPEARILAGGHSLIPMMKLRLAQPEVLVDINGISDLRYLTRAGDELRIGALTRHAELLESALAAEHFAILRDAEQVIADPVVRNWGTVGGSLCQADPSEDLPAAFAALKGSMIITGQGGTREVSAREFYAGPYQTVVGPAEMLTEIRLPVTPGGGAFGSGYLKVARRAGDWPVGAAGAAVWLDRTRGGDVIAGAGIGLTALGARHFVAAEAEDYLRGRPATAETLRQAGQLAAEHCLPASDQRGPADYKRHLAGELTTRVLKLAIARARGPAGPAVPAEPAPGGAGGTGSPPRPGGPPGGLPPGSNRAPRGQTEQITVYVNGLEYVRDIEPRLLLIHFIRDKLGLTGSHWGCDTSNCGACVMWLDETPVKSCTMLAVMADGRRITTIEGLGRGGRLDPVQEGFAACHGLQCGFCTPGMMMTARWLLDHHPDPAGADIREAISGQVCRCTGYENIVRSIQWAAEHEKDRP